MAGIQISADEDGSHITLTGPPGFGVWHLNFPEMFLLDGNIDQKNVALSVTKGENGTIVTGTAGGKYLKEFKVIYAPSDDHVDIVTEVRNTSRVKWQKGGEAMFCLSPRESAEFPRRLDVGRILVRYEYKYQTMAQMRDRFFKGSLPDMPSFPVLLGSVRGAKSGDVFLGDGLIVRGSTSGKQLVAAVWDQVDRVSMSLEFCTHSNPRINALRPGDKEIRRGKVYFLRGDENDMWTRYLADADYFSASRGRSES